ncbi:MAG: hypothetical protein RPR40_03690 [Bermanella sp.]
MPLHMTRYLFVLSLLYGVASHGTSLDGFLLGWPDGRGVTPSDGFHTGLSQASWVHKGRQSLAQYTRRYSASHRLAVRALQLAVSARHLNQQLKFKDQGSVLALGRAYDAWALDVKGERWHAQVGNRSLQVALNMRAWRLNISKTRAEQTLNLNAQSQLHAPRQDQFIFRHTWRDTLWQLSAASQTFSLSYQQLQHNHQDYEWRAELNLNSWRHQLSYHHIYSNYGQTQLADPYFYYGEYAWQNSGQSWHWQSRVQGNSHWWAISLIDQEVSLQTRGSVSLLDVLGPSANIAGANWFWGVRGSCKNSGVKVARGWQHFGWRHRWQISLNKLTPHINAKVYKSLILLGLPSLQRERELDIDYTVLAVLGWQSQFHWQAYAITGSLSQLLPLHVATSAADGPSAPSAAATDKPTPTERSHHVGYRLALDFNWYF